MSTREIITEVLEWEFGEAADDQADDLLVILHDAGYRILGPGELDAETLERAAQVAESTPAYGDPVEISVGLGPVGERIASAIRALKDSQPQTERQAE